MSSAIKYSFVGILSFLYLLGIVAWGQYIKGPASRMMKVQPSKGFGHSKSSHIDDFADSKRIPRNFLPPRARKFSQLHMVSRSTTDNIAKKLKMAPKIIIAGGERF